MNLSGWLVVMGIVGAVALVGLAAMGLVVWLVSSGRL